MSQNQPEPDPDFTEAEVLRHEVIALISLLAHNHFLDAPARDRARAELAAALERLERMVRPEPRSGP